MSSCAGVLLQEYKKQIEFIKQSDEIILYGRSVLMPIIDCALRNLGITIPIRIFDQGKFLDGQPNNSKLCCTVILCAMRLKTRNDMQCDASHFFKKPICFDYFAIYYKWITEFVQRECDFEILAQTLLAVRDEHAIPNLDSVNTSFCNLNCKECSNGMQYRKDKKTIPVEKHLLSIKHITDVLPIAYCNIQGGEPFLDVHLAERLLLHAQNPRIAFISLATNGTIVPTDEIFKAIKDTGATIRISDYGILSRNKEKLVHRAKDFSIPCDIYQRSLTWRAYGELKTHKRTIEENQKIAKQCHFGTKCLMLYDGRLYCCCRTLFANAMGVANDAVRENVIDVYENFDCNDLSRIISGSALFSMCDYCDYPMVTVGVAEQILHNNLIVDRNTSINKCNSDERGMES